MTATLRLGLYLGYWGPEPDDPIELVLEAERLGFDSVWTSEAYGSDALSPLCWIGARTERIKLGTNVLQISARTPTSLAMTIATMDHLCDGRMIVGLGVSGPQVVEGWYGQPFEKPLARTRAYIEIFRDALERKEPLTHAGPHFELPFNGPGSVGLGKPLRLILHPRRPHVPVLLGAGGQRNVAMSTEIADGWLPSFYSPYREGVYEAALASAPADFEIAATVPVAMDDDLEKALAEVKGPIGFYIGGMGATSTNFHLDQVVRLGFEKDALEVQRLFAEGRREEAFARVPDELVDEIALVGPADRICSRLEAWRSSRVTTLLLNTRDADALRVIADAVHGNTAA